MMSDIIELQRHVVALENIKTRSDGEQYVDASLSSEEPVDRGEFIEILDHSPGAVDLGRALSGLPLLFGHDTNNPIGIIDRVRLKGRRLVGRLRFGKSRKAGEVWEDVRSGVLKYLSVGYKIHKTRSGKDGVMRVVGWEPYEASVVGVPADITVGINRQQRIKTMDDIKQAGAKPGKKRNHARGETHRVNEILALGKRHNHMDDAVQAVREGVGLKQFREKMLDKIGSASSIDNGAADMFGAGQSGQRNFSLGNVVKALIENDWSNAGFEREVTQELRQRAPRAAEGVYIPSFALAQRSTLTSSNSSDLIGSQHLSDAFIDTLSNQAMVIALGATVLQGLSMNVSIPRMTAGSSASWVAEGSAPAEGTPGFDSVSLQPNQLSARNSYSRKMLVQAHPDLEQLMRSDLTKQIAIALDAAAINGSGAGNEPTGILNTTGIGDVAIGTDGGAATWAHVVDLETEVAIDNADLGNLGYLTNAQVRGKLKQTEKASNTGQFVWEGGKTSDFGRLNSNRAGVSNNVPSNLTKGTGTNLSALIFGNWADLLIGEFGSVDLIVDPYTNADTGNVRIAVHAFFDISVRHPESFAAVQDIVTT